jgi:hypothetical protein
MEPSQIQRSLLEDSGGQLSPARLELVLVGSVHAILVWFVISFSSFRRFRFQKISKNRRTPDDADETDESNPNSRMIKTKMSGVRLMVLRSWAKNSLRRGSRGEHRSADLRRQTRRKCPSLSLGLLALSPCYFLKLPRADISEDLRFSCACFLEAEIWHCPDDA